MIETIETLGALGRLIFALGLEVYRAIKEGEGHVTVDEIFDGVKKDLDEIDRLEIERFGP